MTGASDDRWENGAGSIVASKASFAHARAVVNDQCCYFIVTHVGAGRLRLVCRKKKIHNEHSFHKTVQLYKATKRKDFKLFLISYERPSRTTHPICQKLSLPKPDIVNCSWHHIYYQTACQKIGATPHPRT
jgi:hypothetical protein